MLDFNLEVDYNKTRVKVEKFMENYENWKIKLEESKMPVLTAGCVLGSAGTRGYVKSKLENQAIYSVEMEEKLIELVEVIKSAFNRLEEKERRYLAYKFFDTIKLSDDEIEEKMMLSKHTYRKTKRRAYIRFAMALGIEVVDEKKKRRK